MQLCACLDAVERADAERLISELPAKAN